MVWVGAWRSVVVGVGRTVVVGVGVVPNGEVAATKVGALPKNKLKEWIESVI